MEDENHINNTLGLDHLITTQPHNKDQSDIWFLLWLAHVRHFWSNYQEQRHNNNNNSKYHVYFEHWGEF